MKKINLLLFVCVTLIFTHVFATHEEVRTTKITDRDVIMQAIGEDRYGQLPILRIDIDMENAAGYINNITPEMMQSPIMKGTTQDGREFVAFKWVDSKYPDKVYVETLFQHHKFDTTLWVTGGDRIINTPFHEKELTEFFQGTNLCVQGFSCYHVWRIEDSADNLHPDL